MAAPVWNPVQINSDRTTASLLAAGPEGFQNLSNTIGGLLKDQENRDRQRAADERATLMFNQQQDERARLLGERAASDKLAAGLLEGQQKTWYDVNDDVRKNQAFNYGDIGVFETKDAAGNSIYTDGKNTLSKDEAAYRLKQQNELGALLDKPQAYYEESRPEMYKRLLSDVKASGGIVTPALVEEFDKAKTAEIAATEAKRKEALASIGAKEKAILDLKTKYGEKLAEVGSLGTKVLDSGSETVSMSDQKVAGLKALQDSYKASGISKAGAANNYDAVRRDVVGTLDKLFNTDDKKTIDMVTKLTMEEGISPEVAANVLSMYKDSGLISNSFSEKPEVIEAAIRAAAMGDKDKLEASFKGPSRTETITKKNFTTQEGYIRPEVTKYFQDQINSLNRQIANEKSEIGKLSILPAQRQQAEKEQLAGDIEKILTGYTKPSVPTTKEVSSLPAPTTEKTNTDVKTGTAITYNALPDKAKKVVDSVPPLKVTATQKAEVIKDIKESLRVLPKTSDIAKFYEEFNGQLTKNAGDVTLDPLAILGIGAALKGLTPKVYTTVTQQLAKTKLGTKLLEKVDDIGQAVDKFDSPSFLRNIGPKLDVRPSSLISPTTAKAPYSSGINLDAPVFMRQGPKPPIMQGPKPFNIR